MEKNTSVTFSGSGYLFPVFVGSLTALEELEYVVQEISGTSGGSIVAALYATGMSVQELKDIVINQDFSYMMSFRLWGWWDGFCDPNPLLQFVKTHTNDKCFSDVNIPLYISTTDITDGKNKCFSSDTTPDIKIADAVRASTSLPFIYPPMKINDKEYVDGGITEDISFSYLKKSPKIGIETRTPYTPLTSDPDWLQMAERLISVLISSNENARIHQAVEEGSVALTVNPFPYTLLQKNMSKSDKQKLFDMGYEVVMNNLSKLPKGKP